MLLVTAIAAGAVALLIGMSIALGGIGELSMGRAEPKSAEVSAIADGCMEEAFLRLSFSSAYAGGALSYGNGNCVILVTAAGEERTIWVTATLDKWTKRLMARMNISTSKITSWGENAGPNFCGELTLTIVFAPTSPTPFADGVTIDTVNGTGVSPNAFVTVGLASGGGMIVTPDASDSEGGLQVQANSSGNFIFQSKRPTGGAFGWTGVANGVSTWAGATEVGGGRSGCLQIDYVLPSWRRFDMNMMDGDTGILSPTQTPLASPSLSDGYLSVLPTHAYLMTLGFGWNPAVSGYDRSSDGGELAQLRQEGHGGQVTSIFQADLPSDTYWVNITLGDRLINLSKMRIRNADVIAPGGILAHDINTLSGQWTATGFAIPVLDRSLNLEFSSLSAPPENGDPIWLVNGIEIHPATSVQGKILLAADSVFGPSAPADGTTTRTIRGATNLPAGSVITVSSSLGTITTADTSAHYTGTQVQVVAGGGFGGKTNSFTFTIRSPLTAVPPTPTLIALEISGTEQASVMDAAVLTFTP